MTTIQWYYTRGQQQCGPVSSAELKRLAEQGDLTPDALVWRDGMKDWIPARGVKGLFEGETPASAATAHTGETPAASRGGETPAAASAAAASGSARAPAATFEGSPAAFQRSREGKPWHLFDYVLARGRVWCTPQFVDSASRLFAQIGHYAIYVAMVLVLAFDVAMAVKTKQAFLAAAALVEVAGLAIFQYAASRFLAACQRLNRASPGKMGSSVVSDLAAILLALAGVAMLLGLTIGAIGVGSFWLISTAVIGFIVCEFLAVAALNPETLNLSVASEVLADEEFLGVFSFVLKLGLRLAPVGFALGIAWGMIDLVHALVEPSAAGLGELMNWLIEMLYLGASGAAGLESLAAVPTALAGAKAKGILFIGAAFPVYVYFGFLFLHFLIDVNYAILSIPIKLDRLRHSDEGDEGESP